MLSSFYIFSLSYPLNDLYISAIPRNPEPVGEHKICIRFRRKAEHLEERFEVAMSNLIHSNMLPFLDLFEIRALPRAI